MYKPVPREQILSSVAHLRQLYRGLRPSNDAEARAFEKREVVAKNLLSNLARTKEHPTLHTVLEVADIFSLTLGGAHRLFGYNLDRIREYDFMLNGASTRIIESYPFDRDLLIDLPAKLADDESIPNEPLHRLVPEWQRDVPIRALQGESWRKPGAFYVQVGTEDSLGTSLPPGAIAMVEPISPDEQIRPNPRSIYLLQFSNGYRCSRCVATGGKLLLLTGGQHYKGPQQFSYPRQVRIAGKVRMFALDLPMPEYPTLRIPSKPSTGSELKLPWEHCSLSHLLSSEYERFQWMRKGDAVEVRNRLETAFGTRLSARTERRYRHYTDSRPHIDSLIQMSLMSVVRYRDSLRAAGVLPSDRRRYSLEALMATQRLQDIPVPIQRAPAPKPTERWNRLQQQYVEWPPLLSMKYPQLRGIANHVVRLSKGNDRLGLDPALSSGTMILLGEIIDAPNPSDDMKKRGWSPPIYAHRRGRDTVLGYLTRDDENFALFSGSREDAPSVVVKRNDISLLSRVCGVVVPV